MRQYNKFTSRYPLQERVFTETQILKFIGPRNHDNLTDLVTTLGCTKPTPTEMPKGNELAQRVAIVKGVST